MSLGGQGRGLTSRGGLTNPTSYNQNERGKYYVPDSFIRHSTSDGACWHLEHHAFGKSDETHFDLYRLRRLRSPSQQVFRLLRQQEMDMATNMVMATDTEAVGMAIGMMMGPDGLGAMAIIGAVVDPVSECMSAQVMAITPIPTSASRPGTAGTHAPITTMGIKA